MIFTFFNKKIKFNDIAKNIDEKNHSKISFLLVCGLKIVIPKKIITINIFFEEIQITIADLKGKKIEDVLPRVFMPTFS